MPVTWKKLAYESDVILKSLLTTTGDIIYASAPSTPARLGIGTGGQVLTVSSGLPAWATPTPALHASTHADGGTDEVSLDASQITSGRFVMARMPDGTANYVLKAQGAATDPVYGQVAWSELTGVPSSFPPSAHASTHKSGGSDAIALNEFANPTGNVNFAGYQALDLVIHKSATQPTTPVVGKAYFDTDDLAVYICTSDA